MKKIVFCLLALVALVLTSCLPDTPGYSYTSTFVRLVTIDHSVEPPVFYADLTNQQFQFTNIQKNSDLEKYELTDAPRALIVGTVTAADYAVDYTLGNGSAPLEVTPVCNKDVVIDESFGPVYGFSNFEVESGWTYPYAWVSRGYLNIIPQIKTDKVGADRVGEYMLVPEGVSNDTLSFSLHTKYSKGDNLRGEFQCFDLRTLRDTATADAGAKPVMAAMIDKLNHTSDSVMVVVVADYMNVWPDTIIKTMVPTNYFYLRID